MDLLRTHLEKYIVLQDAQWEIIQSAYQIQTLNKKEFLVQNFNVLPYEVFVLSGCLKTYVIDSKGVERILQFSPEGWWCGDFDSFQNQSASILNIQAIEHSTIAVIQFAQKEALFASVPELNVFFRILIQNSLISLQRRLLSSMSEPADQRYAKFMQKYPGLDQRISQHEIASFLGITPEFLSKTKKNFIRNL